MHVVVYAQLTYCGLCGEGTYLYLSKASGHLAGRMNLTGIDQLTDVPLALTVKSMVGLLAAKS
jgi:hypothetical protein